MNDDDYDWLTDPLIEDPPSAETEPAPSADEGVGYQKPSKKHQFQKGQSGNPKGRPKKKSDESATVRFFKEETYPITIQGKTHQVSPIEMLEFSMFKASLNATLSGKIKYTEYLQRTHPDLFKQGSQISELIVKYILPEGRTMEDYPDLEPTPAFPPKPEDESK